MSEQETINAILTQNPITVEPQSRGEKILRNIVNGEGTEGLEYPQNRGEAYLYRIAEGGSGNSIPEITLEAEQFVFENSAYLTEAQYEAIKGKYQFILNVPMLDNVKILANFSFKDDTGWDTYYGGITPVGFYSMQVGYDDIDDEGKILNPWIIAAFKRYEME